MGSRNFGGEGARGVDRRTKKELLGRLEADAQRICARFRLRYRSLEAERGNVKRRYGVCYSDGTIRIRLRHAISGTPLKYSSLVNTLCHELAHLEHFNHGPRFQTFYAEILGWARREGIYKPRKLIASTQRTVPVTARPSVRPAELLAPYGRPAVEESMTKSARRGPPSSPRQLELFG